MRIKISKIAEADNALFPSPDNKDFVAGQINEGVSLPLEYYVIGELTCPIEKGKRIEMLREIRNGIKYPGIFVTSPVQEIDGDIEHEDVINVETENSKYKIEYLHEELGNIYDYE